MICNQNLITKWIFFSYGVKIHFFNLFPFHSDCRFLFLKWARRKRNAGKDGVLLPKWTQEKSW